MSILINGMEMPKSCKDCALFHADSSGFYGCFAKMQIIIFDEREIKPDWCPLVEVVRTGEGLYDTYTPLDKETAKHVTEVFRKSTERMETEE